MRKDVVPVIREKVKQLVGHDGFNVKVVGEGLISLFIPANTAIIQSEHPEIKITAPHYDVMGQCRQQLGLSPP